MTTPAFGHSSTPLLTTARPGIQSSTIFRSTRTDGFPSNGCSTLTKPARSTHAWPARVANRLAVDNRPTFAISHGVKSRFRRARFLAFPIGLAMTLANTAPATAASAGARFAGRGKVTMHRGEPCTSQIMFDFRPLDSKGLIWMAASAHDSAKLTEAAGAHRRVQISGVWRRGQHADCGYVEVTKLVLERSWFESLWKSL